ncbi:hypothetical protein B0H12DRAFT_1239589 [Mycena haematopus]|nr:hypothetical protein B0H12DRAFT_1239589 [Mycena haematopus]
MSRHHSPNVEPSSSPSTSPPPFWDTDVPNYLIPPLDDTPLQPHIAFVLADRLNEESAIRDPPEPYAGNPLPGEEPLPDPLRPTPQNSLGVRTIIPSRQRLQEKCAVDAARRLRYRLLMSARMAARRAHLQKKAEPGPIRAATGGQIDAALVDDRDYLLGEVTGPGSRFNFRYVSNCAG